MTSMSNDDINSAGANMVESCGTTDSSSTVLPISRARATSGFFAKSTLDPECGEKMRPSLILGMLFFKQKLCAQQCRELLLERLVSKFQRFRSKVVLQNNAVFFQELCLADIDMELHCQEVQADGWTQADLDAFLSSQYQVSKSIHAPLWVFYVLNGLADGRSCLVANVDHSIGDGATMIEVLMSLLDAEQPPPQSVSAKSERDKDRAKERDRDKARCAVGRVPSNSGSGISLAEKVFIFASGVVMGLAGPLLPGDTPNPLKLADPSVPGLRRTCSFGEKISLARVKEVKSRFQGATVNDVLSAVLNMAVRRYFEAEDPSFLTARPRVRALFPINMRDKGAQSSGQELELGNCFSSGVFQFFFDYESRTDLVWRVKSQVDRIKLSPQPLVELWCLQVLFWLLPGKSIIDLMMTTFGKFTMTLSNVPGPQTEARFGGQPLDDMSFVACSPIGLYCGLLSYNGQVSCGLCSDPTAEADPDKVTRYWKEEFDALYAETMAHDGEVPPPKRAGVWRRNRFTIAAVLLLSAASWAIMHSVAARPMSSTASH